MSNSSNEHWKLVRRFTAQQKVGIRKKGGKRLRDYAKAAQSPLLHAELARMLKAFGHTDMLLIADKGFPIPKSVETISLGLTDGIPTIMDVLNAIRQDFTYDRIIITNEMKEFSPNFVGKLTKLSGGRLFEGASHNKFKHIAQFVRGAVRTADTTPYGNIILVCG